MTTEPTEPTNAEVTGVTLIDLDQIEQDLERARILGCAEWIKTDDYRQIIAECRESRNRAMREPVSGVDAISREAVISLLQSRRTTSNTAMQNLLLHECIQAIRILSPLPNAATVQPVQVPGEIKLEPFCERCGMRSSESASKYCGNGDDKDNGHVWRKMHEGQVGLANLRRSTTPAIPQVAAGEQAEPIPTAGWPSKQDIQRVTANIAAKAIGKNFELEEEIKRLKDNDRECASVLNRWMDDTGCHHVGIKYVVDRLEAEAPSRSTSIPEHQSIMEPTEEEIADYRAEVPPAGEKRHKLRLGFEGDEPTAVYWGDDPNIPRDGREWFIGEFRGVKCVPPGPVATEPPIKTIDEIREAFFKIHNVAIGKSNRSYMSIPVDRERDADCIVSDAIDELERLRGLLSGPATTDAELREGAGS